MPAPQLSAAWWKKNRALLCKDVGLEKALKDYEKAKPPFERDMNGDNYGKLTLALNAVAKVAKAQAKHCQDTGHQKTKGIAEGYEDVVQDALKEAQKARLDVSKAVETLTQQWKTLLEGAIGLNERCSRTEQRAAALAKAVADEVAAGNAAEHKKDLLACAKELGDHKKELSMVSKEHGRLLKAMKTECGPTESAAILKGNPNRLEFGIIEKALDRAQQVLTAATKELLELEKERLKQEKFVQNFAGIEDDVPDLARRLKELTPVVRGFLNDNRKQLEEYKDRKGKLSPELADRATELFKEVREINHQSGQHLDTLMKVTKRAPNVKLDYNGLWESAQKTMRDASAMQGWLHPYSKDKKV
ncbi:MAG: hypothetical protein JNM56_23690 [Planctomycetia bacterium]|nr:hypothetical protein [Planctomycetia bacterium]